MRGSLGYIAPISGFLEGYAHRLGGSPQGPSREAHMSGGLYFKSDGIKILLKCVPGVFMR